MYFDNDFDIDTFIESYLGSQGSYASAEFGGSSVWHLKNLPSYPKGMSGYLGHFVVHEAGIVVLIKRTVSEYDGESYEDTLIGEESDAYDVKSIRKVVTRALRIMRSKR